MTASVLTSEVYGALRTMGPALSPEIVQATQRLLEPFHQERGYLAPRVVRDLAYGPDPRHRLDVHAPSDARGRPVLVFVHGGGFVRGDKSVPGSPYYDNVGAWAAQHGLVTVNLAYRLAPQHQWPDAALDVAAALGWARTHVHELGGDPRRMVLAGHSAGAAHVSAVIAGHAGSNAMTGVIGAVLLSGVYDPPSYPERAALAAYHGPDEDDYPQRSPLPGLANAALAGFPILAALAEYDLPPADRRPRPCSPRRRSARRSCCCTSSLATPTCPRSSPSASTSRRSASPSRTSSASPWRRPNAGPRIGCTLPEVFDAVRPGQRILFDDGEIEGTVEAADPQQLTIRVTRTAPGGKRLGAEKGINLPETDLPVSALTPADADALTTVVRHADLVGLSFVRSPADVAHLREHLTALGGRDIGLVLKIETERGFSDLPTILLDAMARPRIGVMIARGDLMTEIG